MVADTLSHLSVFNWISRITLSSRSLLQSLTTHCSTFTSKRQKENTKKHQLTRAFDGYFQIIPQFVENFLFFFSSVIYLLISKKSINSFFFFFVLKGFLNGKSGVEVCAHLPVGRNWWPSTEHPLFPNRRSRNGNSRQPSSDTTTLSPSQTLPNGTKFTLARSHILALYTLA